jgi:hypothetical protein
MKSCTIDTIAAVVMVLVVVPLLAFGIWDGYKAHQETDHLQAYFDSIPVFVISHGDTLGNRWEERRYRDGHWDTLRTQIVIVTASTAGGRP